MVNAGNGNRTRMGVKSRRILSPVRLPVPPHRHNNDGTDRARTYDPLLVKADALPAELSSHILNLIKITIYKYCKRPGWGSNPRPPPVTGRRSNQLSHQAKLVDFSGPSGGSNPGPTGYEPVALTN